MNLSTSTVESSSCPCSMKLCGESNDNTEECDQNAVEVGKYHCGEKIAELKLIQK